jgi:hypothetical protein
VRFTFDTFYHWYIPDGIGNHRSILIILSLIMGFFAIRSLKDRWPNVRLTLINTSPIILLVIIYTSSVVFISTTTALDQIGNRFLSPIYVPLTVLALIFLRSIFEPYRQLFHSKMVNVFLIVGVSIWLVSQLWATMSFATDYMKVGGGGYNSKLWRENKTIQHVLQHNQIVDECAVYSNDPYALYILANLRGKFSPEETEYNSPDVANTISTLKGSWPKEGMACLIWFNNVERNYLFTIDELHTIANLHQVIRLSDGMIYYATRK